MSAEAGTLDEAWAAAEAALPEGWRLSNLTSAGWWPRWHVLAMAAAKTPDEPCDHGVIHRGSRDSQSATGPTPAAALLALAAALRAVPA